MNDELLPCPFCGSPAIREGINFVRCSDNINCCAAIDVGDCGNHTLSVSTQNWNRRAIDEQAAEIERLKSRLAYFEAITTGAEHKAIEKAIEGEQ